MQLLHIDSSIQGDASASRAITASIVDHIRAGHPGLAVVRRDLVADPLPHLTLDAMGGGDEVEQFLASQIVVIGAGMYNFTIPSQLKAWIDRILVAGKTFRYGAEGPEGLAGEKRVIVVLARGGLYGEGAPAASLEHAETYLKDVFSFIGVAAPEFVVAEGLAFGEEARNTAISAANDRAQSIASDLLQAV